MIVGRVRSALGLGDGLGWALLALLAIPSFVLQWRAGVPRLDADAVEYYSHLRSIYFDHDVEFTNEFDHFGILGRWDKTNLTATGYRRTNFSVGPALFWMPFYAVGDAVARARGEREDGYSPNHIRAVCIGSLVYAVLGALLAHGIVRDVAARGAAALATLVAFYGTFLVWYATFEATVSHAVSFFSAALILRVFWDGRRDLSAGRGFVLGALIGLSACVRWQNAVFLLLPAFPLLGAIRKRPREALKTGAVVGLGFLLGALPQLLVFKAIFGVYVLPYPVQGRDYLRLDRPRILEALFSSRHGLLFWTPVLWLGFLGLVGLRRFGGTLPLVLLVATMTYVNGASADWWGGGSFSNRRFDSVLPVLALGLGLSFAWLLERARRRPGDVLIVAGVALSAWNLLFMETMRRGAIPRDDTVSFADVTRFNAERFAEVLGSPTAWPANWLFAARTGLPAAAYDEMVGKYLFFRQESLGGLVDLGDPRVDPALLGEGWSERFLQSGEICRRVDGSARLFVALDLPEDLDVTIRAAGSGRLFLGVGGATVGSVALRSELTPARLEIPRERLRPQLNALTLSVSGGGFANVDRLTFERRKARR